MRDRRAALPWVWEPSGPAAARKNGASGVSTSAAARTRRGLATGFSVSATAGPELAVGGHGGPAAAPRARRARALRSHLHNFGQVVRTANAQHADRLQRDRRGRWSPRLRIIGLSRAATCLREAETFWRSPFARGRGGRGRGWARRGLGAARGDDWGSARSKARGESGPSSVLK